MSAHIATKTGRVAAGGSLLVGGIAGALVLAPQAGAATTFTVTNTADSGAGSLRQAVLDANNNPGADLVVFDASSTGTITLTSGDIDITDDVMITGLGAADSIISGNNNSRIFYIYNSDAPLTVSISGLTMTEGASANYGGAIANWGNDLTLSSVVLTGNETTGTGGAIHSQASASPNTDSNAPLTIIDSAISDNTSSDEGGGIAHIDAGDLVVTDTIISGNQSANRGGGVYSKRVGNISISESTVQDNSSASSGAGAYIKYVGDVSIDSSTFDQNVAVDDGGGLYATVTDSFTMTNSTVSGNQGLDGAGAQLGVNGDVLIANSTFVENAGSQSAGEGGALYSWESNGDTRIMFSTFAGNSTKSATVLLNNIGQNGAEITGTVISDNTTAEGTGTQAVDLRLAGSGTATVTSSLIMGTANGNAYTDGGGNVTGVSAQLLPYAGPMLMMEPAVGSPAIDAGPLTWTAFTGDGFDQRLTPYIRVYNGQSDMGAFEVQPEPVPPTTTTSSTSTTTTLAPNDTTTTVGTDPMVPTFTG
jgi:predicted outer membrane repeat protein